MPSTNLTSVGPDRLDKPHLLVPAGLDGQLPLLPFLLGGGIQFTILVLVVELLALVHEGLDLVVNFYLKLSL